MSKIFVRSVLACLILAATARAADNEPLDVIKIRPNFYMIAGDGGNIAVQIGNDGIVLVDSGRGDKSDQVLAALQKMTNGAIRYILNTGAEADHVGGNAKLARAGQTIFTNALGNTDTLRAMTGGGASIMSHDSVLRRVSAPTGKVSPYPVDAWPNEAFFQKHKTFRMNGEGIEMMYQAAAHSDADTFVFFRGSDVVVAGDVLDTTRFPTIDVEKGGSINGEIEALNNLISLAIPALPYIYSGGATYVIPGHGRVCEQQDIVDYRDMVVVVRDVVADLIKQGKTLDQIKAARPALPFETEYGNPTAFVESIYKSLTAKK